MLYDEYHDLDMIRTCDDITKTEKMVNEVTDKFCQMRNLCKECCDNLGSQLICKEANECLSFHLDENH